MQKFSQDIGSLVSVHVERHGDLFRRRSAGEKILIDSPKGSRNSVLPGDVGGLKKSGGPGPLGYDHGSGETSLDHTAGGAVELIAIG